MKVPISIYLAVEDDLSEVILRTILLHRDYDYVVEAVFKNGGFGYLKKQTQAFNNLARAQPILMLTDLDNHVCPPSLIENWLKNPQHRNFLFRVAVREVEAWILACEEELVGYLGIRQHIKCPTPESLVDPKADLLALASKSARRQIREAMTRRDSGGNLKQGPAYNSTLAEFVRYHWRIDKAVDKCPSLQRLMSSLSKLEKLRK